MTRSTLIPFCLASLAILYAPAGAEAATPATPCTPLAAVQAAPAAAGLSLVHAEQIRASAIHRLAREGGGGTLLAGGEPCWDGERNVVRVDFAGRTVGARELARLLTAPELLPAFAHGGLVVAGADVAGTLRLERATLDYPLELRGLVFAEPEIEEVRGGDRPLALHINSSTLEQPVEIVGSHLVGLALVENSRFDEGLNFSGNIFHRPLGPYRPLEPYDPLAFGAHTRSLQILYSEVGGKLRLTNNLFGGRVFLDHSAAAVVEVEDNERAAGMFLVRKNTIGKLSLKDNNFAGGLEVANNRVETLLDVIGGEIAPLGDEPEFGVYANRVGGTMYFEPEAIKPGVERIDLTFNDIAGTADVVLPAEWAPAGPGGAPYHLDLTSIKVGSRLALKRAEEPEERDPGAATGDEDRPEATNRNEARTGAYCYERRDEPVAAAAVVRLTNATVDDLAWRLPRGCRYAWMGTGLTYRSLGDADVLDTQEPEQAPRGPDADGASPDAPPPAGSAVAAEPGDDGEADGAEATMPAPDGVVEEADRDTWRYAMAEPNAHALTFLAQHLRARGELTESREVLMEAKRLDYTPPPACSVEAPVAGLTLYDVLDRECLTRGVGYLFLLPTGFGVKPERAVLYLFAGWFVGWVLYAGYHYRRRWGHGWRPRFAALRWRLADPGRRRRRGTCNIDGFARYDAGKSPGDFRLWVFSADAMLPVVNLHAYDAYFPESFLLRLVSYAQNVLGWFVVTSLFAALTVL